MRVAQDRSVVVLCLHKPAKFRFVPGHYAFIQVPEIDWTYHPFSICSAPSSNELRFIIEIKQSKSWTWKLAQKRVPGPLEFTVNLMQGGFGIPVSGQEAYDHIIAIGTGTGISPMLSLVLYQADRLKLLSGELLRHKSPRGAHVLHGEYSLSATCCASFLQNYFRHRSVVRGGGQSPYIRHLMRRFRTERVHKFVELSMLPGMLFEMWLGATTFSWLNVPLEAAMNPVQGQILKILSMLGIAMFLACFTYKLLMSRRYAKSLFTVLDACFITAMVVVITTLWPEPSPSVEQELLLLLFAGWRFCRYFACGPSSPGRTKEDVSQ